MSKPAVGRVLALSALAAGACIAIDAAAGAAHPHTSPLPGINIWTLAAAFAIAEAVPVHFEHRREAVSLTLTTVPLVIGLASLGPVALIAARLVGSGAALVAHRRQRPVKLTVNLVSFWLQTSVAVLVYRLVSANGPTPVTWIGIGLGVLVGDLFQSLLLAGAISLYQRRWEASLLKSAAFSACAAVVEASLGVVAVTLLAVEPLALVPLAVVTSLVLWSYGTHRALGERHRQLFQLYEFTTVVGHALTDDRVVPTVLGQVRELMHADRAWMYVEGPDAELSRLDAVAEGLVSESAGEADQRTHRLASENGGAAVVDTAGGRPRVVPTGQLMVAPMDIGPGRRATLVVSDRSGAVRPFGPADLRLFATAANQAAVALERGDLINRLRDHAAESEHRSLHDTLTGLPNRMLFARELASAIETGVAAVLLLDLDRFKEVNDTLGHQNGDLLLQQVGTRLREALRRGDLIARLGGDEFGILLPDVDSELAAVHVGRAIVEALHEPFAIGDLSVDVGASVGIALSPRDGSDPVTLLQRADVAMYAAKADQTSVETYRVERDGYSPQRLALVGELRKAIHERELEVHYQPQVNVALGEVTGVEALVRWPHPVRGMVFPDEFIAVAEHAGLIGPLTSFVLDEALRAAYTWRARGWRTRVSVNLSARSLLQHGLVQEVEAILRRYETPAGALCLEITETSIMADPRRTGQTLEALRALGVVIAIDDFGTGHSSLAYVKTLPVGEIKIDKSFVSSMLDDPSDEAIVGTILSLAANLNLAVIAEGVEDHPTADRLQAMGCPTAQGYLYGRPMPGPLLLEWLADRPTVATLEALARASGTAG